MTYRIILYILISCISCRVAAQLESLPKASVCSDIAYSSSVVFVQHIKNKRYDSAQQILTYWESKCGVREPIFRAQVIIAFANGRDADSLITPETIFHLQAYRQRAEMIKTRDFTDYDYNPAFFGFVPVGQELDSLTVFFFKEALRTQQPGTTGFLLCGVYTNNADTLFSMVQSGEYRETALAGEYYKLAAKYINLPEWNIALLAGGWIPTGGITKLGVHPDIGFQLGAKYRKVNIDFTATFKFLPAKTPYYATRVRSDNSVVLTDRFFGGYFGIDGGYDIWRKKGHEAAALFGIGLDGFDAIEEDSVNRLKAESTWTYNFNFGLGYRYYLNNSVYIGLRAKYNIVDYSMNGVVNFTGNPITVHLVVGGLSNMSKRNSLEYLRYKWRRETPRRDFYFRTL